MNHVHDPVSAHTVSRIEVTLRSQIEGQRGVRNFDEYAVSAAMSPIILLVAMAAVVSDFGRRYDSSWLPAFCGLLMGGLAAWAIVTLRSLGTKMAQLNAHHDLAVSARALKWRILLSNIVTNVVMVLALTAVYRMAIHLVYTHELNS